MNPLFTALPTVRRPERRLPLSRRLFWTAMVALVYVLMSITPLWGLAQRGYAPQQGVNLVTSIVFGTQYGTLAHLGIGPIVIAGILMEVLAFSGVMEMDLNRKEDRLRFTLMMKWLALGIALVESVAYMLGGQLPYNSPVGAVAIVVQLLAATLVILLLDDIMSKGWGIGSAISLIIFLGVARQMFLSLFSWDVPPGESLPTGIIPALGVALYSLFAEGDASKLLSLISRPYVTSGGATYLPDLVGLLATLVLGYVILYLEMMRVNVPLTSAQFRGIRVNVPLRLVYVSVLPIIFTTYSLALAGQLISAFLAQAGHVAAANYVALVIGTPQRYFDPLVVVPHVIIYLVLATAFAWVWVQLAGLSAEDQARNIARSQLHVPGFRQSERVLAMLLERPIRALTVISGLIAGAFASVGNLLGVWGSGVGLILLIEIGMQYYALVTREQMLELYPGLRSVLER